MVQARFPTTTRSQDCRNRSPFPGWIHRTGVDEHARGVVRAGHRFGPPRGHRADVVLGTSTPAILILRDQCHLGQAGEGYIPKFLISFILIFSFNRWVLVPLNLDLHFLHFRAGKRRRRISFSSRQASARPGIGITYHILMCIGVLLIVDILINSLFDIDHAFQLLSLLLRVLDI